jgi:hypothetical protein
MTNDFVNYVTGYLKSRRQEVDTQNRPALQGQSTKKSWPSAEWHLLREWIKNFCEDANRKAGQDTFQFRVTQNLSLEVTANVPGHGNRTLYADFNPETSRINYRAESDDASEARIPLTIAPAKNAGTFVAKMDGTESYSSDGSEKVHVGQMGQVLIKALLDMPE